MKEIFIYFQVVLQFPGKNNLKKIPAALFYTSK